jgi:hypothetical protein
VHDGGDLGDDRVFLVPIATEFGWPRAAVSGCSG